MDKVLDVKAIQERLDKATPGPWFSAARQGDDWQSVVCLDERYEVCQCFHERGNEEQCDDNTRFIAHARTDIHDLLSALSEYKGLVREMALELTKHVGHSGACCPQGADGEPLPVTPSSCRCQGTNKSTYRLLIDPRLLAIVKEEE